MITNPPSQTPLHDSNARYAAPQLSVSQGSATVPGGQVTLVYDDYGTQAPVDRIIVQTNTLGGTSSQFKPARSALGQPIGTDVPISVNITDPKFNALQALDITATIAWPNLSEIGAELVPPDAVNAILASRVANYPGYILLFNGDIGIFNSSGTPDSTGNLGATALGVAANPDFSSGAGTVFDSEAVRSILNGNVGNTAQGHFKPQDNTSLSALQGLTGGQLNGTWTFRTFQLVSDTSTSPKFVNGVTLNFSSGNNPGSVVGPNGNEVVVADKNSLFVVPVPGINPTNPGSANAPIVHTANTASPFFDNVSGTNVSGNIFGINGGAATPTIAPAQAAPILPAPTIASDNTLGSFSAHQGRIYVTFTGMFSDAAAGNTDIFLSYSDDGGKDWSSPKQVNDDNSATDGYSGADASAVNINGVGTILGRTQYQPQVAVDPSTGNLVVSFFDARNDPSNARVATYIAASSDGSGTFAGEVYANPSLIATDAVTGNAVNLGPIPDNESATGTVADALGFGPHQALVVVNGRIVSFWASNENKKTIVNPGGQLDIVDSILSLPAGPRIIASTQGPVGIPGDTVNTTRAADGTTLANTILVTFDRPIDPATFPTGDVSVYFEAPTGGAQTSLPVTSVTPVTSSALGTTQFKITFDPTGLASFVGTYSYVVRPTGISDRIRHTIAGGSIAAGNVMDQNANGIPGQVPADDYAVGQPTGFITYQSGTLPLIVSGPTVSSVAAVNSAGAVISSGIDNLVLNNTVGTLQVTFDRNIQVSTLTPAQVLGLFGPAGVISTTGLTITPLTTYSGGSQAAYAGGATADVFNITFPSPQLISGTYSLTLGSGILAADGSAIDVNRNAGLDVLRGVASNGVTTPVTYAAVPPAAPSTIAASTVNMDGTTTPSTLTSPIVVPDNFPIQGDTTFVSGLTLSLDISYPTDPDLSAYLLAPDGVTRINLFTSVGNGTNTANFSNTTFSDVASTSVDKAGAPFFGTFLPEAPFSNLATASHLNTLGTWSLVIVNAGSSTGTLNSWSLTFRKPVSTSGLGEFNNDRSNLDFRIFNLAATNALANSTWTAVGPAGVTSTANGKGTLAGAVSTVAVDPSDTTGNTVYVGTASGGIWKTTNFLTPSLSGPTYVPLTDFGPSFAQNIGSIAVFGRNNDPSQSVIYAGTGFGEQRTNATAGNPNVDLNTGLGNGVLRSMDGGKTWQVLNFGAASTYKIVVDPTPTLTGQVIVYAATSSGLYQSLNSGDSWSLLKAGNATDILLDPNSKSPTTGNLDILYTAFTYETVPNYPQAVGVYVSTNQGQTLAPVNGLLGKDPLIVTPGFPAQPIPVLNPVTPNNANAGFIALAKPALTGNIAVNLNYQGWLFAAVENKDGTFQGLYVTKDAGENWTLVQLPNIPGNGSVKASVATGDTTGANSYDPTSSNFTKQGLYDLTLTADPTNPNIVYIGGSHDFQGSGLIRVDLTDLHDAHNFTAGSNNRTDGGLLTVVAQGGVTENNTANPVASYLGQSQFLNLRYAPNNGTAGTSPFNINSTLVATNTANFINDGTGVLWSLFDEPLKANPGDVTSTTNLHDAIDYIDPITGQVRIIFADDQGVYTSLVNPDGTLNNGIGSDVSTNYSRNGNLQNEQFFTSAAQPSKVASTAAGALFYGTGQTTIAAQSDANVLTDGNLVWDNSSVLSPVGSSPRNTSANSSISSSDRSGVGIATDPTGATTSLYEFDIPILGGNLTDFFRVNQFGQTTGLASNVNQEFPGDGFRGDAHQGGVLVPPVTNSSLVDGQIPEGDFIVNPLNGNQILIASATGTLYETVNKGIQWVPIGSATDFGSIENIVNPGVDSKGVSFKGTTGHTAPLPIQVSAIAYGAPDPNVSGGVGNLNNFVYVGTTGVNYALSANTSSEFDPFIDSRNGTKFNDGHIFFTQAGGQGWTDASRGLDGSTVVGIYPDPDRGSHAAYAVTLTGVFYSPDTVALAASGRTVWTNITSNLTSIQRNPFGNPAYQQSVLAPFSYTSPNPLDAQGNYTNIAPPDQYNPVYNSEYGGFTGIVADYRYEIPASTNASGGSPVFFPVLYASGYGGVFRSIDNGATWTVFPNTSFDAAPVDGGYLPNVDVTNLSLVLGDINPDTGHAVQATGDPEVLLASTFGRGDFAIRLAPDVIPTSVQFDANMPTGGSDTGVSATDRITNSPTLFLDGISELSNYGNTVTITLTDQRPGATFGHVLGTATTNTLGQFIVQILNDGTDPSFFASSTALNDKIVGIQATDSSGASGNITLFRYTYDVTIPSTPGTPALEATYDTGRFNNDDLTNLSVPAQPGPGGSLTIVAPIFDVTTPLPTTNPLTPNSISLTLELLRATNPNGPFFLVASVPDGLVSPVMLTDSSLATLVAAAPIDQTFYYEAIQVDAAGNVSTPASNVLAVTVDTITPATPTGLTLDPSTNSGSSTVSPYTTHFTHPIFDLTGILANDQALLYRSVNGGAPILVGTAAVGASQVTDTLGATADGVYTYSVAQLDIYGNFSLLSPSVVVTINTQAPPSTPVLEAPYDTGRFNNDDITNIAIPAPTPGVTPTFVSPIFDVGTPTPGTGQPAIATVQLFRSTSPTGPFVMVGTTPFGTSPAMVTDTTLAGLVAAGPIDQTYYYEADAINAAGIESDKSAALAVLVDNIVPATLPAPTLDPASNSGLVKSQLITNVIHPTFDTTNLLPNESLRLYRSTGGKAPILVGTAAVGVTQVTDTTGAVPDGVYLYQVVQLDIAGNVSNYSMAIAVTINTSTPVVPTIMLLTTDDSGLPTHPNVTNVRTPHFVGNAQFNSGTNFPLDVLIVTNGNDATGKVVASTLPAANGTYLAQITTPLADGTYVVVARTTNLAGTFSYSAPLTITIKATGPQIIPTLSIFPADDTGIKGDGVTANHNPRFTGKTDPGDLVTLYAIINGQLSGVQATTTASTINGSFTFKLPFNLTDGSTQLVAQASDIANNRGVPSAPFAFQIVTTAGDYLASGAAQLSVFDPLSETYYVRGVGVAKVDSTPGRDIPVEYDYNGDGLTDLAAYRYNTAEYFGFVSNSTILDQQFGAGGSALPVSGYFGGTGQYIYGSYQPVSGTWALALPQPGGLVINFGLPKIDIPTPAAFDGSNSTELAVFRPVNFFGNDADSFTVIGPKGLYSVSFTSPAVAKLGFVFKPGDIPAPADYDGVGKDEFAVYRPTTGQFFILKTPDVTNSATWTIRTVTLNLPGGPNANDVPASQDYDGNGKVDPTVFRPSNSTFYLVHSSTGIQENIQFGAPNQFMAAAGPLLYRLTALRGAYASNAGYYPIQNGGGGIGASAIPGVHASSIASAAATTTSTPGSAPIASMIAVASPIAVGTPATGATSAAIATINHPAVTVGAATPRSLALVGVGSKAEANVHHPKAARAKKPASHLTVDSKTHADESRTTSQHAKAAASAAPIAAAHQQAKATSSTAKSHAVAAAALQLLVLAKKGRKDS